MAKAALNMIVRTSAPDYAKDGIHLNAVDTGWVTDEDPAHLAARKVEEHAFSPPLDVVDGAARARSMRGVRRAVMTKGAVAFTSSTSRSSIVGTSASASRHVLCVRRSTVAVRRAKFSWPQAGQSWS